MASPNLIAGRLEAAATDLPTVVNRAGSGAMAALLAEIVRRAPIDDGEYKGSWQSVGGPGVWSVFTAAPQAVRLEMGYHGTDSKGRTYNQPAQPHVRPAVAAVRPSRRVVDAVKGRLG